MDNIIPIFVPLCIALMFIIFGRLTIYKLTGKGEKEAIGIQYLPLIFYYGVPGICFVEILSYYFPAQGKFWFFCWLLLFMLMFIIFIVKARRILKNKEHLPKT